MLVLVAGCGASNPSATPPPAGSSHTSSPVEAGSIVFRRYGDDSENTGSLFAATSGGKLEHRITQAAAATLDDEPAWAPDGSHLVFTRITGTGGEHESHRLFTVNADGTGLTALSPDNPAVDNLIPGWDSSGAYSPDGKLIAFTHAEGNVAVDGSHGLPQGSDQIQHSDIWIMNADGTHRRQVTRSVEYTGDSGGVAWSPDGTRLVYAHYNSPVATPAGVHALFVVDADGHHQRQLTPWNLGAGGTPAWSAATNLIAFRAVQDEEAGMGNFFTIQPDGTGLRQVTHFTNTVISHKVGFSPDGAWIVFARADSEGANDVYTARADGSQQRAVTKTAAGDSSADWGPSPG